VTVPDAPSEPASVTLHATWRHIVLSSLGAAAIAGAGTWAVVEGGFRGFGAVLFLVGWVFVAIVLLDVPVASTFTPEAVTRHTMLRRQRLAWQPDDRLTRSRPSVVASADDGSTWKSRRGPAFGRGALALKRGRRQYLLVDRVESVDEFERLLDVLEQAPELGIDRLARPSATTPPTWLYRRRKWRPDAAGDR
jgi:hypothetical protein